MARIRIEQSLAVSPEAAAAEVAVAWAADAPALVAYFASSHYDPEVLAGTMRALAPPGCILIGCSTAGELGLAGYQTGSLVALSFPAEEFCAATAVFRELKNLDMIMWLDEMQALVERNLEQRVDHGFAESFCLMLVDGLSVREEPLARTIKMALGSIPLIGGSAGDDLRFERTHVFCDGEVLTDAAVVVVVGTRRKFRAFKTQHFVSSPTRMVVTGARPAERVVTEINGRPAAEEFARLVGIEVADLTPMSFAAYPVVVRIGDAEYVRSIQKVNPDLSLSFFCAIDVGLVFRLARGVDAVENLESLVVGLHAILGEPEAILACDCILRNLEFQSPEIRERISELLRRHHIMGFSTYGEQFEGMHVNQTMTGIAFAAASS